LIEKPLPLLIFTESAALKRLLRRKTILLCDNRDWADVNFAIPHLKIYPVDLVYVYPV
jgi:hypothetical protein